MYTTDGPVFLARLSFAISETCPKIKHRWSKCEPYGLIMKLDICFTENSSLGIKKISRRHKGLWFNNKPGEHLCFSPALGDLARILITSESVT